MSDEKQANRISTLNEGPLHAALKKWYAQPGDRLEVPVEGFIIDIVRDGLLIEIQTSSVSSLKRKLTALADHHPIRLVDPIPQQKWIVRLADEGRSILGRRRSPKRGQIEDIVGELVSLPRLLAHPNFSLEVLLTHEEAMRRYDGSRGWRRKGWVIHERRLLDIIGQQRFFTPGEMAELLPPSLAEPFTTADLAAAIVRPRRLAQRMAYCLREMREIEAVGKQGNAILYARVGRSGQLLA